MKEQCIRKSHQHTSFSFKEHRCSTSPGDKKNRLQLKIQIQPEK